MGDPQKVHARCRSVLSPERRSFRRVLLSPEALLNFPVFPSAYGLLLFIFK